MPVQLKVRVALTTICVALSALIPAPYTAAGSTDTPRGIDTFLTEAIREHNLPGATYAVVDRGIISAGAAGKRPDGSPLTTADRFLWGSVSKPVAATVAQSLADAHRLDLDAPIRTVLPYFRIDDPRADGITTRQLLQHTSGLPFGAEFLDVNDPARRASDVVRSLTGVRLISDPGHAHHYSSLGYVVAQAIIEHVAGESLTAVEAGMFAGLSGTRDLSGGSRMMGGRAVTFDSVDDGAGAAYGYQGGDVIALARFAAWQLDDAHMHVSRHTTAPGPRVGDHTRYGLGWRIDDDGIIWHSGTVPGYFSAVYLQPDHNRAVVVLLNASGVMYENTLLAITRGVLELAAGERPAPVPTPRTALAVGYAGLFALAVVLAVAVRRVRSKRACAGWLLIAVAAASSWVILPATLGVPPRYLWLWAPDTAVLMVALPIAAAVVAARRLPWRRTTTTESPESVGFAGTFRRI